MCVTVILDGQWISSVEDLRAAISRVVINDEEALRERVAAQGGDLEQSCLCVVEIEDTAKAGGFAVEQCDFDSMCYRFTKRH